MGLSPGYTLPGVLNGVRGGMFGGPRVGFVPGLGPCISTVTPCGMLPIRTIASLFTIGVSPGLGCVLAGTFMNNPGSICSACFAVVEYPAGLTLWLGEGIGVTDPLQVMQTVQAEIGLWVQASVGHDSGDHVEVEGVIGQVQFEEALGLVGGVRQWPRLWIVGPPDRIESGTSPTPRQKRQRTKIQRSRGRPLLEARWYVRAREFKRAGWT
jgi:hypothetical protein